MYMCTFKLNVGFSPFEKQVKISRNGDFFIIGM